MSTDRQFEIYFQLYDFFIVPFPTYFLQLTDQAAIWIFSIIDKAENTEVNSRIQHKMLAATLTSISKLDVNYELFLFVMAWHVLIIVLRLLMLVFAPFLSFISKMHF